MSVHHQVAVQAKGTAGSLTLLRFFLLSTVPAGLADDKGSLAGST